jgi:hyperosmotically inducible periplasmic protein
MKSKKLNVSVLTLLGMSLLSSPFLMGRATPQDAQKPAADNTKTNQRDKDKSSPTADQQKTNSSDSAITRKIRVSIQKDKSLSSYAHNVKIITQDGKVTLKGPVRSEDEKSNIATKAVMVAGDTNVDNQLDVAPSKQ